MQKFILFSMGILAACAADKEQMLSECGATAQVYFSVDSVDFVDEVDTRTAHPDASSTGKTIPACSASLYIATIA